jgi:acyl-coenzyme A thioesterase 9
MFLITMRTTQANLRVSPVPVAPLIVETEEEKRLFKKGEANYQAKRALRKRSLLERAPDDEESDLIHSMWTKEMSYLSK